jgi:O-antigen/teichoic acid export membrane protein
MKLFEFKNLNLIKKFLEGSSLLSLEKVIRILLGLTVHSWVVRSLGSEKVGYISYVSGVVMIFQTFSVFGLDEIASKKFVQLKGHIQTFEDISAIRFRFAFFSFFLLVLFSLLTHFDDKTTMLMCFIFGLSLFPKSFITLENYSMTQGHYQALFWSRISAAILVNVGKILAVLLDISLVAFMGIYLLEELAQRFINYQFVKKYVQLAKVRWLAPIK